VDFDGLLSDWIRKEVTDIYRPYVRVFYSDKRVRTVLDSAMGDYLEMAGRGGNYVVNYRCRPFAVHKGCAYREWGQALYTKECSLLLDGHTVKEKLAFADLLGGLTLRTETSWGYVERHYFPASLVAGLIERVTVFNEGDKPLTITLDWPQEEEISSVCPHKVALADPDGKMLNDIPADPERTVQAGGSADWYLVYYPAHGDLLVDCVLEGKKRAALVEECMAKGMTSSAEASVDAFVSHAMLRGLESVKFAGEFVFETGERPSMEIARSAWTVVSSGDGPALGGLLHTLFELYAGGCKDVYVALAALTIGVNNDDTALYALASDCLAECHPHDLAGLSAWWECLRLGCVWAERQGKRAEAAAMAATAVKVESALAKRWHRTQWGGYYREGLKLGGDTFYPLVVGAKPSLLGALDKLYDGVSQVRISPKSTSTTEEGAIRALAGLWEEDGERPLLQDYCRDRLLGCHAPYACEGLGGGRRQRPYLNLMAVEHILKSMWGLTPSPKGIVVRPASPTGRAMRLNHWHYLGKVYTLLWQRNRLKVQDVFGTVYYDGPAPQGQAVTVPLDQIKRS